MEFEVHEAITQPQIPQGDALLPTLHQMVNFMKRLVAVPHSEIKAQLDAEKKAKAQRRASRVSSAQR